MERVRSRLPTPTKELVQHLASAFLAEARFERGERALTWLFNSLPRNTDSVEVLLKVVSLNSLYRTQILAVSELAEHIVALDLDPILAVGSHGAVEAVAACRLGNRARRLESFASKYCSWHRPNAYPILDSVLKGLLWQYQQQDPFATFKRKDLDSYSGFTSIHSAFVRTYDLADLSLKTLDKGLWMLGRQPGARLT